MHFILGLVHKQLLFTEAVLLIVVDVIPELLGCVLRGKVQIVHM